ncbi:MAG: hypothetical protein RLW62_00675, partial [Gammaproteobacteria bacterium]
MSRTTRRARARLPVLAALLTAGATAPAGHAADFTWVGGCGDGFFDIGSCWDAGSPPLNGDDAILSGGSDTLVWDNNVAGFWSALIGASGPVV